MNFQLPVSNFQPMSNDLMSNKQRAPWGPVVFLFPALVLIDQVLKYWADDIYRNYGFVFSLPMPRGLMFSAYLLALGMITFYFLRNFSKFNKKIFIAWVCILAGAYSNVGERFIMGFVRDWIYIQSGIFNLADGYIILGVLTLLSDYKKPDSLSK
ncbi:MAG: signal peptidase II [Candidatus Doudnabacteria bacterium]|nr:signal peptidase II [Candidatus Doudnabacteria bacterium]